MDNQGIKKSVQRQFANAAQHYSTSSVHRDGVDLRTMVEQANLPDAAVVLDAGCGAGHTALAFAPHAAEVIAYDLAPEMLQQVTRLATERGLSNVQTQRGDVEQLPFADDTFDAVVTRYSAHHWPRPQAALAEFARVLKPNGVFLLSDVVAPDDFTADTFLQTLEMLRDPSHVRDHSVKGWQMMLSEAGFTSETLLNFDIALHFGDWLKRIGTTDVNAAALRELFVNAAPEIKTFYHLPDTIHDDHFEFMIYGAVLRARLKTG